MLKGKCVLLGITGSIAAYKIASLASALVKLHADVHVIMTKNATQFINPLTFETLTNNRCVVDMFDRNFEYSVKHIALAKRADIFMIVPASANVIAKMAHGIADDMLTTTILASSCPKYVVPTMNSNMYNNQIVQDNINKLKHYGFNIITPTTGLLACGDIGVGKMPEVDVLLSYIMKEIAYKKDMIGINVLVTAGPTQESIDPVRYITNHSSGKMGYAIAENCMLRGANVTLISGPTSIAPIPFVKLINAISASEMANKVKEEVDKQDIIIKTAAVADYTPIQIANKKIKKSKDKLTIELKPTIDILADIGINKKPNQFVCGFSMETEKLIENSQNKLIKKNLDMIVANNLKTHGAGFKTDTNVVTIITKNGYKELQLMSKKELSLIIIDEILKAREMNK